MPLPYNPILQGVRQTAIPLPGTGSFLSQFLYSLALCFIIGQRPLARGPVLQEWPADRPFLPLRALSPGHQKKE